MNYIFGVCAVLPHLAVYLLASETPQETRTLPGDGLNTGRRTLLGPSVQEVSELQLWISCVLPMQWCVPFLSSLLTLRVQSLKGFAEIVTLLFFPGTYSTHVLGLLLLL